MAQASFALRAPFDGGAFITSGSPNTFVSVSDLIPDPIAQAGGGDPVASVTDTGTQTVTTGAPVTAAFSGAAGTVADVATGTVQAVASSHPLIQVAVVLVILYLVFRKR